MQNAIQEIIDFSAYNEMLEALYRSSRIPSAVIDLEGRVLAGAGWQRICVEFHRKNPAAEKLCIESDTRIRDDMREGKPQAIYECPHGLIDSCCPLIISGEHVANVFTGQLLYAEPDAATLERFRAQARHYGFDESAYLAALAEVPVFAPETHHEMLEFLNRLTSAVIQMGLDKLQLLRESELRVEQEQRYRVVLDATRTVPWQLDLETGKFTFMGRQVEDVFGSPAEDWTDLDYWLERVHPDDRETVLAFCMMSTERGEDHDFVYRAIHADDSIIWIRDTVIVVNGPEGPKSLIGYMHDITESKQAEEALVESEERYQVLFEKAAHGSAVADAETGVLIACNHKLAEMLGYRVEELVGQPQSILHPPIDLEDGRTPNFRRHIGEMEGRIINDQLLTKSGEVLDVEIKASRLSFAGKEALHGFFYDVTERKKLMQQHMRSAQLAALGTVAAGVAHEINNPIQGILNYATLIRNTPDKTERVVDIAERIIKESGRIAEIVRNMLYYSREKKISLTPCELGELVKNAAALIATKLRSNKVDLKLSVADNLPPVMACPQEIEQVVINLIDNSSDALRTLPAGRQRLIEVSADAVDLNGEKYVLLEVLDNGEGISDTIINRVQDAFFSTKPSMEGTGLGLSIVTEIIQKHGALFHIESEEGEYTKVVIVFPAITISPTDQI